MPDWNADPLIWGAGETRFEIFLEPTCPFSGTAFGKLGALLDRAGDRITVRLWLHVQPWHLWSPVVTRAVAGASTLDGGRDNAWSLMAAIYEHRGEFAFENHAAGANRRRTPDDLLNRLSELSRLPVREGFERDGLEAVVKRHTKYARQNGIHGSPTVMVDGLVRDDIGSDEDVASWTGKILG